VLGHLQVLRRDQLRRSAGQPADPDRVRRRLLLNPVRAGVEPEAGSRTQRLRIACPIQRDPIGIEDRDHPVAIVSPK
jgi:hypothetical protein